MILVLVDDESYVLQLKEGIPNDPRFPDRRDEWLTNIEKESTLITQWLEDFKSKFGEYPEAKEIITEVEDALALYQLSVGKNLLVGNVQRSLVQGKMKVEIQRAI